MGLEISDAQLDQTLANIASEQGATIADLRKSIEATGESFKAYREEIRQEITISQVRRANVDRRIYINPCLLYTSPSPRDRQKSRMPSSA